jgi:ABC-2 type transport system ATP-binding protein
VIGKGELISAGPVTQFVSDNSRHWVRVVTPQLDALTVALVSQAVQVTRHNDVTADVFLADAARVGELASSLGVVLHELSPQRSSLEDAFLEVTKQSQEYRATVPTSSLPGASPPSGPPMSPTVGSVLPPPPPPASIDSPEVSS